jgi:RNA polymerase sigma-70 factor (ECF subfamily)
MEVGESRQDAGEGSPARRASVESVARQYGKMLSAQALRFTRDPGIASDLLQDAFERALLAAPNCESERLCRWLMLVMRNLSVDQRRRQRTQQGVLYRLSYLSEAIEDDVEGDDSVPADLTVERVQQALECLDEPFRRVFELHLVHASLAEISRTLSIPSATAGTRLFRARRKLRKLLEDRKESAP